MLWTGPKVLGPWQKKQWSRHVLASGLVIEVEAAASHVSTHSPIQLTSTSQSITFVRTPSPQPSEGHDSSSDVLNDGSVSTYQSERDSIPPRQNEDYYFEPTEELQLPHELSTESTTSHFESGIISGTRSSPALPQEHESRVSSDDWTIYSYHYPPEWDINPPRQGGDYYFEQLMDEVRPHAEPFHHGDPWQLQFIPTLLRFFGTRINPWDYCGDSFISILRRIWAAVYAEPSWPDEDEDLVHALATKSVSAWFESFGVNALVTVENYLKCSTNGSSSFAEWSTLCKKMVQDGRLFYERPGGLTTHGIYRSVFVVAPLSSHIQAIQGGIEVQGLDNGRTFPYGAIGLAAAGAFRAMQLFGMQLVTYDESGKLVIKASMDEDAEFPAVDTSFCRSTAGGTTRQCAFIADLLTPDDLSAILSLAGTLALESNHGVIGSGNEKIHTDDD